MTRPIPDDGMLGTAMRFPAPRKGDTADMLDVRSKLIADAEATLPSGQRYELRLMPEALNPDRDALPLLVRSMCWIRDPVMDDAPDWTPADKWSKRSGYQVEFRTT